MKVLIDLIAIIERSDKEMEKPINNSELKRFFKAKGIKYTSNQDYKPYIEIDLRKS